MYVPPDPVTSEAPTKYRYQFPFILLLSAPLTLLLPSSSSSVALRITITYPQRRTENPSTYLDHVWTRRAASRVASPSNCHQLCNLHDLLVVASADEDLGRHIRCILAALPSRLVGVASPLPRRSPPSGPLASWRRMAGS